MEATPKQQVSELIKNAQSILLVTHKNPDGDALGSVLALKIVLEKLGKKVSAVTADAPNRIFDFLPKINEIERRIEGSKDLIVSLDVSKTEIGKIGYKKDEENKLVNIVITPREKGQFGPEDVKISDSKPKFDLIISVDTPNLERLGEIASPADIFFEVPVVNIDHHPSNERFGKINLVELVATSSAEILVSLLESVSKDSQLIDSDVATCLLTGLIYDTSSFQNVNTTPKSLTVAAQLVAAGGRQQEIVKNLYKTKSMETLKLWGLVLTKVKEDKAHKFLWSSVSKEDISNTGADEGALSGVVDELLKSATDVDFAMLLSEREGYLHGSLRSIAKGVNVASIAEAFGGGGHEVAAAFRISGDLKSQEEQILSKISKMQDKNHGSGLTEAVKNGSEKAEVKADDITLKPEISVAKEAEPMGKASGEDLKTIESVSEALSVEPLGTIKPNVEEMESNKQIAPLEVEKDAQKVLSSIENVLPSAPKEEVKSKDEFPEDEDAMQGRVKTKW